MSTILFTLLLALFKSRLHHVDWLEQRLPEKEIPCSLTRAMWSCSTDKEEILKAVSGPA